MIFIEIGNTNIKFVKDTIDEIVVLPATRKNLIKVSKLNEQKFILNSNHKFDLFFSKKKLKQKYWLFNIDNYKSDFNFFENIDINEIGYDLLFLSLFIKTKINSDCLLISNGTCLTSILKLNNKIVSISIGLGFNTANLILKNKFGFIYQQDLKIKFGNNTNNAINLHQIYTIDGIIEVNKKILDNNFKIILTGNGFNNEWFEYVSSKYQNVDFIANLTLLMFREWILKKILK